MDALCALALRTYPPHTSISSVNAKIHLICKFCLHDKFYFSNLLYQQHQFFFFLTLPDDIKTHSNEANYIALSPFAHKRGGHIQLGWKMIICSITGCNRAREKTVIHHQLLSFLLLKSLAILSAAPNPLWEPLFYLSLCRCHLFDNRLLL